MKKTGRKIIAVLLTMAMLVSTIAVLGVTSFAASSTPKYKGYTIIGDSITAGMGVKKDGKWDKNLPKSNVNYAILKNVCNVPEGYYGVDEIEALRQAAGGTTYRVHGSYPDLVGKAVGIKIKNDSSSSYANLEKSGFYDLALPGLRTTEIRKILDSSFTGDAYTDEILSIVNPEGYNKLHKNALKYIKNSELITICAGSNDVALNCMIRALHAIYDDNIPVDFEQEIIALCAQGLLPEAIAEISHKAKIVGKFPLASAAYLQGLAEGSQTFMKNWDPIITRIHELNPNARIVVVGFYNPFKTYALTDYGDENVLRIGHALDPLLGGMDAYVTQLAKTRNLYDYANIWDVDVIGIMPILPNLFNDYFKYILFNVHPTNGGHKYIAGQIEKVLQGDKSASKLYNPINDIPTGYYYVQLISNDGGTVTANTVSSGAADGSYVRVKVQPNSGKSIASVTVVDMNGKKVECDSYRDNIYTFRMPKSAVQVVAMFN